MKEFVVYDPASGEISISGTCQDFDVMLQGAHVIEGSGSHFAHYVASGVLTAYSAAQAQSKASRPAYASHWDNATMAWIDDRTLSQVQADAWAAIKARRDAEIMAAGATPAGTFDTTPEGLANVTSVAVMLMAAPAIASVNFTLADNTRPAIARADFIAAAQAIGAAVQALYDHAAGLRTQIEAATTTAAVQAIAW